MKIDYYNLYTFDNQFIKRIHKEEDIKKLYESFTGFIETPDKHKLYFENGQYHRLGGPAFINVNGQQSYIVYGKHITKEKHDLLYSSMKLKGC